MVRSILLKWRATCAAILLLAAATTLRAQGCDSCEPSLPPGKEIAECFANEDGSSPSSFVGFQDLQVVNSHHAVEFVFPADTEITHVCIGLRRHTVAPSPVAGIQVRAPNPVDFNFPGAPIGALQLFNVNPVGNHQVVELDLPVTVSGHAWVDVIYYGAETTVAHQGCNGYLGLLERSAVWLEGPHGQWQDYQDAFVYPNLAAVIRPMTLIDAPRNCTLTWDALSPLITSEQGADAYLRVQMGAPPTANVTVSLNSSDPTEGVPDRGSLVFTPANWNQPQVFVVEGQDDPWTDGDVPYSIAFQVFSADPCYDGLIVEPGPVLLQNLDDDSRIWGIWKSFSPPGRRVRR
jgi:hypothetical protein